MERTPRVPGEGVAWGAVAGGTLVLLALLLLLLAFGATLGLTIARVEEGRLPPALVLKAGAIAGAVSVAGAFLAAGYLTGVLAGARGIAHPRLHGLLTWAFAVVIMGAIAGPRIALVIGGLFAERSVGTLLDELEPRVVSDVQLGDGKITSRVVTERVPGGLLGALAQMDEKLEEMTDDDELRNATARARRFLVWTGWLVFAGLGGGAWSAVVGASTAARAKHRRAPRE